MERNILRIETSQDILALPHEPVVLLLHGQLVAETLPSLIPLVSNAYAEGRKIELDLDGVVRADRAAAEYLARINKKGVRLRRCPLALWVWLTIADGAMRNEKETP